MGMKKVSKIRTCETDFDGVRKLLLAYEVNTTDIVRILGIAYPTARKKLRNPEYFTLGELKEITLKTDIPQDEMGAVIWTT